MAKEHFIESYGDIRYTIGYGNSGGALAQQWLANAYPGLYSGIIVGASFPDAGTAMVEIEDCSLLQNYFRNSTVIWTDAQKAAAAGHPSAAVCNEWINIYGFHRNFIPSGALPTDDASGIPTVPGGAPTAIGGCDIATGTRYDPTFNPTGPRCTLWDAASSIFGKGADGSANRPWANVGVQYGLNALLAGSISAENFIDLNSKIGSHTQNYDFQSRRADASPEAVKAAYRSGYVNVGNGMNTVAIIDMRRADVTGIHHQYRSWVMRARLDRAFGGHGNQAIWFNAGTQAESYTVMDAWLAGIERDTSGGTIDKKIVTNRPTGANDRCNAIDGLGLTMEQCTGVSDASTRMGAGGGLTDDVVDCELKPLDRTTYGSIVFNEPQWQLMKATFPTGVCDFSKPGKNSQVTQMWQTYLNKDGSTVAGGRPMLALP